MLLRRSLIFDGLIAVAALGCVFGGSHLILTEGWLGGGLRAVTARYALVLLGLGLIASFTIKAEWRRKAVITLTSLVTSIYAFEIASHLVSTFGTVKRQVPSVEDIVGIEVRAGNDIVPTLRPMNTFFNVSPNQVGSRIVVEGKETLVLSSIPFRRQVYCVRSGGEPVTHVADRYGYRNPDELWDAKRAQVVVLGDSFVRGTCVDDGETMVDALRRSFPRSLNLGTNGTGPLIALAALREYGAKMRPAAVVFALDPETDLGDDLNYEKKSPILMKYLALNYTQDLAGKRSEITDALTRLIAEQGFQSHGGKKNAFWSEVATLRNWQGHLKTHYSRLLVRPDFELFGQIIRTMRDEAGTWGGRVYVLHVPSDRARRLDARTSEVVKTLGVDLVPGDDDWENLGENLFDQIDPWGGHFTPKGYRIVGEVIAGRLRRDGID
jgi:hypothetical protein